MTIPTYEELMLPLLLGASTGLRKIPELADDVSAELGLTDEEKEALLPSGRQRVLHNRLHWAKFYMTKAGLIEAPKRGLFTATATGRALLEKAPAKIDNSVLDDYPSFRAFLNGQKESQADGKVASLPPLADDLTPEEKIDRSAQSLEQNPPVRSGRKSGEGLATVFRSRDRRSTGCNGIWRKSFRCSETDWKVGRWRR